MKTMKTPTPKQIEQIIARNNRRFKKASPAQRRVLIAQDVLDRLRSHQFTAEVGHWIHLGYVYGEGELPAQRTLLSGETCNGCALGGLMMSCTVFNNQVSNRTLSGFDVGGRVSRNVKFANGLNRIFSKAQLRLIETAFECGDGFDGWGKLRGRKWEDSAMAKKAIVFGNRWLSNNDCLKAIMKNIVKNKGTFKP